MVLKEPTEITGLRYVPRGSGSNGNLRDVKLVVTDESGKEHTFTVTDWPDNNKPKDINFGKTIKAKKIVLTGTKTYGDGGDKYQSAAELIFTRPQVAETPLDMSAYEAALAKAQKLTDKENQEEVASVQASMKYAMDNHLLTERMVKYFADYLNQLKDSAPKPDDPTSSKGEEQPPVLEVPEYTGPLGTAGTEAPPTVELPEYTGPLGTVGTEAAPTVELPEYAGPLGTAGTEAAPTVDPLKAVVDKTGNIEIIGKSQELADVDQVESNSETNKNLSGKKYDVYNLQLKNQKGQVVKSNGNLLVRLPVSGEVEALYAITPSKNLQELAYIIQDGKLEFTTADLTAYAIVYKAASNDTPPAVDENVNPSASNNQEEEQKPQTVAVEEKGQLPATGEQNSTALALLGGLALIFSAAFIRNRKRN